MTLEPGTKVWIPCRVTRGTLPDQCRVQLQSDADGWTGFLDIDQLRDAIADGETAVVGTVVESSGGTVTARLPGQVARRLFFTAATAEFEKLPRV